MTHYYPVVEIGFVFTDEVIASINLHLFRKSGETLGKIRYSKEQFLELAREHKLPDAFYDTYPVLQIHESIQTHEEFEGIIDTFDFTLLRNMEDTIDEERVTYICYLPLEHQASYLAADVPYKMSDEMLDEVKEKLKDYLPEDFDFGKYLCQINGVYLS